MGGSYCFTKKEDGVSQKSVWIEIPDHKDSNRRTLLNMDHVTTLIVAPVPSTPEEDARGSAEPMGVYATAGVAKPVLLHRYGSDAMAWDARRLLILKLRELSRSDGHVVIRLNEGGGPEMVSDYPYSDGTQPL